MTAAIALDRTVLLVRADLFPRASLNEVVDALTGITVRIAADREVVSSRAGQTALVASALSAARSGADVRLDVPSVRLPGPQPPITAGADLASGLDDLLGDLVRPADHERNLGPADLTVVLGSPSGRFEGEVVYLSGDDASATLAGHEGGTWRGGGPFGGLLAGPLVGAHAFRLAMRKLAEVHGLPACEHDLAMSPEARLVVPALPSGPIDLGRVDMISGGAMNNAAMAALLRVDDLRADLRVFDHDIAAESNLNRYWLLRRSQIGLIKVDLLERFATDSITIKGVPERYDEALAADVELAERIVVGVDHVPSRWLAQRNAPGWVGVGATSHFEAVVSGHAPGAPCAGCLHPHDEHDDGDIPTVSFVSEIAGALLAHRLLCASAAGEDGSALVIWPFALGPEHGVLRMGQTARVDCPVPCAAAVVLQRRKASR
jgi:hypothetical protein